MKHKIRMVHLFPSFSCNLQCAHCYVSSPQYDSQKHEEFTDKLIKRIIEFFNLIEPEVIHIEGGEPLLFSKIYQLIAGIKDKETLTLVTNGTIITDKVVGLLENAGLRKIVVSLEGPTENINSILRGNNFKKTTKAIKLLGKSSIYTSISFSAGNHNLKHLEDMAELTNELGADELRIGNILDAGRGKKISQLALSNNELLLLLGNYLKIKDKFKDKINITLSLPGSMLKMAKKSPLWNSFEYAYSACDAGIAQISIGPKGEISPCYNIINNQEHVMGNILDECVLDPKTFLQFDIAKINKICPISCSGHFYVGKLK